MRFIYTCQLEWPRLAWLARCESHANAIHVTHGAGVDCHQNWFCEAVWDAPYQQGNFDRSDLVFGSGGRIRDDAATFVSSATTVDRLQHTTGDLTWVSNSLPCLLEAEAAQLDPGFRGWLEWFESITRGIATPHPDLPLTSGSARLVYHDNLEWNGHNLKRVPKHNPTRDFSSFEGYRSFVQGALKRIGDNLRSDHRANQWSWLGTISGGYDSAASAVMAREAGLRRVMTLTESRPGIPDSGEHIAAALGLDCRVIERLAWQQQTHLEPLFIAADGQGKEILFAGASDASKNRVLVTGVAGDSAWGSNDVARNGDLARSNHSGLSLTEYRLHAGFLHLPVPFMGLRQHADLTRLSQAPELAAWDVGGRYSRPIPRRVVEESGVDRNTFGRRKTGASVRFMIGEDPWSRVGRMEFASWLRSDASGQPAGQTTWIAATVGLALRDFAQRRAIGASRMTRVLLGKLSRRLSSWLGNRGINDLAFLWATDRVRARYPMSKHARAPGAGARQTKEASRP